MIHDAIIVGAGLSGLVCARRLIDAGARTLVLEARPRVGGRLWSGALAGAVVDLGGQWLSVDQPRLLALAGALGVASSPQPRGGRAVIDDAGRSAGLFAQLSAAIAQWRAARRIDRLARAIPPGAPAEAADAAALDAIALGPWLAGAISHPIARERIAMHAELVFAADPAGLSLLGYLARLGATGGFAPRGPDLPGGGRDHRFVGGAQTLALRLAEGLGDAVQLGAPVDAIERDGAGGAPWSVRGPAGSHHARQVVLAVPPSLAAGIAPELPAPVRRLGAAMQRGSVVKCFAAYDRAFWRDAGLSGEAYRPRGTVRAVVDATPPDRATPVLLAFVVGAAAEAWRARDPADRRREVLDSLAALFGDPARTPLDYLEADWAAEPWSAGCVAGTPPGALVAGAAWRGSHDGIHLAGAEAAARWPGYMEGAIEAGERAAAEVAAALPSGETAEVARGPAGRPVR
ncbi:MAG TPA: NAD(P)/FAD-dependent oxidoreductase [Kofleriaceae bacterium]|nr:NAD(P)/FAD-dependent oxidoreductase [Kofleriaceae bacterium]